MMQLRGRSYWPHFRRWERRADAADGTFRLATGPLVVANADLAHEVLVRSHRYLDQSAFLRTLHLHPLSFELRTRLLNGLSRILANHDTSGSDSLTRTLFGSRHRFPMHTWGIWYMRCHFADVLAKERSSLLVEVIDRYVREQVIKRDVIGQPFGVTGRDRSEMFRTAAAGLRTSSINVDSPVDLVDVVGSLGDSISEEDRGELFLRMVLSVVGFTGTAFEWGAKLASVDGTFRHRLRSGADVRPYLEEAQRMHPTSWRLLRTVRTEHTIGDHRLLPNDRVLVATHVLHRSPDHWDSPLEFRADRWNDRQLTRSRAFLPFGRGRGMCPAREVAYTAIEDSLSAMFRQFEVRVRGGGHPHVRTLQATPSGTVRFS